MFAADKPIRHVEDDKYGREKYVDNLAYALLTGDDSDGLVVGIEGAWGSGKHPSRTCSLNVFNRCLYLIARRTSLNLTHGCTPGPVR